MNDRQFRILIKTLNFGFWCVCMAIARAVPYGCDHSNMDLPDPTDDGGQGR